VALVVIGSATALRRRRDRRTREAAPDSDSSVRESSLAKTGRDEASDTASPLLSAARRAFGAGQRDAAVQFAYAAARSTVVNGADLPDAGSHWELYRALRSTTDADLDGFRRLTVAYERAAFDSRTVDEDAAREALSLAEAIRAREGGDNPATRFVTSAFPETSESDGESNSGTS
jgi:hypothetical protein